MEIIASYFAEHSLAALGLVFLVLAIVGSAAVVTGTWLTMKLLARRQEREQAAVKRAAQVELAHCEEQLNRLVKTLVARKLNPVESSSMRALVRRKATLAEQLDIPLTA